MNKRSRYVGGEGAYSRDISIWLDGYDDIFSDFDSRPYSARVISDDFVTELSKVSKESESEIKELKLLLPEKAKDKESEEVISKRLHSFFRKNFNKYTSVKKKTIVRGITMLIIGCILMLIASYISSQRSDKLGLNMIFVILEPAGWFMVWSSLDELFYSVKKRKPELEFYAKMANSKITFVHLKKHQEQYPQNVPAHLLHE